MIKFTRIFIVLFYVTSGILFGEAVPKRTIVPEDVVNIRKVSDPQISFDGKRVAFVVTEAANSGESEIEWDTNIWVGATSGIAPPRQYTFSPYKEVMPRWSPDGRYLAFLSNRGSERTYQIYLLPMNGGEAERIICHKEGIICFKWLPDSETIAYMALGPSTDEEEKQIGAKSDAYTVDRHFQNTRLFEISIKTKRSIPITQKNENIVAFDYSLDAIRVCLLTARSPNPDDTLLAKMVIMNRDGTERKEIMGEVSEGGISPLNLCWAPRDDRVAFFKHVPPNSSIPQIISVDGASIWKVSDDYRGAIWEIDWLPDGDSLLVSSQEGTQGIIGKLDSKSMEIKCLRKVGRPYWQGPYWHMNKSAGLIAFIDADNSSPEDIWIMNLEGSNPRKLTHMNPQVKHFAFGEQETVSWKNPEGMTIEGILIKPSHYRMGERYPLVVVVHGGPTWSWWRGWHCSWHEWAQFLSSNGYAVLLPNPRGSGSYGITFAQENINNWGSGPFQDIVAGVDFLIERGIADPDRLGIGGWSYGGYMSAWAVTQTSRFKAAVMGAGISNLKSFYGTFSMPRWMKMYFKGNPYVRDDMYEKNSPINFIQNAKTPTLIIHGEQDTTPPVSQSYEFYNGLREMGVETELVLYPREGHSFEELAHQIDLLKRILNWYDSYLK